MQITKVLYIEFLMQKGEYVVFLMKYIVSWPSGAPKMPFDTIHVTNLPEGLDESMVTQFLQPANTAEHSEYIYIYIYYIYTYIYLDI